MARLADQTGQLYSKWPSSSTSSHNNGYPKLNSAEGWRLCRWHQTEIRRWRRGEASTVANLPHRTKRPVNPPGNQPSRYPVKSMTTGLGRLCRVLSVWLPWLPSLPCFLSMTASPFLTGRTGSLSTLSFHGSPRSWQPLWLQWLHHVSANRSGFISAWVTDHWLIWTHMIGSAGHWGARLSCGIPGWCVFPFPSTNYGLNWHDSGYPLPLVPWLPLCPSV